MWQPLCADDPFPGDVGAVTAAARSMQQMATRLQEQAAQLRSYQAGTATWQGIAKDAFANQLGKVPTQLDTAHQRYDSAARALGPFGERLQSCKGTAEHLRIQAQDAQRRIEQTSTALTQQRQWERREAQRASAAVDDPSLGSSNAAAWHGPNNARLLDQAHADLDALRRQLANLIDDFGSYASGVAATIRSAADIGKDDGGIKGWFSHRVTDVKNGAKDLVEFLRTHGIDLAQLSDILGKITSVVGLLALLPLGPVSAFLGGLALGLSLVTLAMDTVLMLAGEQSFGDWAIGAALTLAPFAVSGIGAVKLARSARATQSSTKIARTASQASFISNFKTVRGAEAFAHQAQQVKLINTVKTAVGVHPAPALRGLSMEVGSAKYVGAVARNTSTAVLHMGLPGPLTTISQGLRWYDDASTVVEGGQAIVEGGRAVGGYVMSSVRGSSDDD